jgi:purine-binding chemotaxis protein CheW
MPAFVLGVCRLRSEPTVVLELERALFGAAEGARPQRWIALKRRERPVALAVTDVLGVQRVDLSGSGALPTLLASSAAPFVERLSALDQQLFVLLNAARLLPDFAWPAPATPAGPAASNADGDQPR